MEGNEIILSVSVAQSIIALSTLVTFFTIKKTSRSKNGLRWALLPVGFAAAQAYGQHGFTEEGIAQFIAGSLPLVFILFIFGYLIFRPKKQARLKSIDDIDNNLQDELAEPRIRRSASAPFQSSQKKHLSDDDYANHYSLFSNENSLAEEDFFDKELFVNFNLYLDYLEKYSLEKDISERISDKFCSEMALVEGDLKDYTDFKDYHLTQTLDEPAAFSERWLISYFIGRLYLLLESPQHPYAEYNLKLIMIVLHKYSSQTSFNIMIDSILEHFPSSGRHLGLTINASK